MTNLEIILLVIAFVLLIGIWLLERKYRNKIYLLELEKQGILDKKIDRSNLSQTNSVKGQIAEQWAPLLPDFPVKTLSDVFHYGGPIDYIGYEGLTEGKITKIWFIDAKLNKYSHSKNQSLIQEFIKSLNLEKIKFEIYNPREGAKKLAIERNIDIKIK
jgi:predicted Holliday junction resolvase-like endonuclease